MNVDEFKKLNDYIKQLTPKKLLSDMGLEINHQALREAEGGLEELGEDFFTFFLNSRTTSQAIFLSNVFSLKTKLASGDIVFDVKHEFDDREFDISIGFDYEYDPSYGSDADGNRGRPAHFIGVNSLYVSFNGKRVDLFMAKSDLSELQKELEREYENKALESCSKN